MPRRSLKISSSNYYVTTTANNRIKVWQLQSAAHTKNEVGTLLAELFEPNYLKIHYSAIALFDDHQNINNNNSLLVLGDKVGRIVLFNITKACKVLEISQHTIDASKDFTHVEGGHHSSINSIRFDIDMDSIHIITCSNDKKLCRWDLNGTLLDTISTNEDTVPSCFTVTHPFKHNKRKTKKKKKTQKCTKYAMIASNHIHVWHMQQPQSICIGSFQGHAQQARHMQLSDDNQYLISCGQDRFVYLWKCKSFYKKKRDANQLKSAEYSLALDDDIVSIDIKTVTQPLTAEDTTYLESLKNKQKKKKKKDVPTTKQLYYIAAASKSAVYIWCFDPIQQHQNHAQVNSNSNGNGSLQPVVEITIADEMNVDDEDSTPSTMSWVQHIQFMNSKQLMILRGTSSIAVMKQIDFIHSDSEMDFIGSLVLENVTTSIDTTKNIDLTGNVMESQEHAVVDPHLTVLHVADVSIANPKSYELHHGKDKKRKREDDEPQSQPPTKKQRVESNSVTFQDKLYAIEKKTEEDKNKGLARIPNADSLYTLLTQSLAANDQTMFERLLTMQNDEAMREFEGDMIKNTLDRIPAKMAVDLLEKLTEKFRVSPRQSISILRWLLPLLNSHSASFAKNLSSRKHLISVHQAIDYQIKSLLPAMKLQGRLSLLMNQMEKVTQFTQNNHNKSNITNGLEIARNKALFLHDEETTNKEQDNQSQDLNVQNDTRSKHDFIQI